MEFWQVSEGDRREEGIREGWGVREEGRVGVEEGGMKVDVLISQIHIIIK